MRDDGLAHDRRKGRRKAALGSTSIIGPAMTSPSGSHAAGALRAASMARSLRRGRAGYPLIFTMGA